MTYFIQMLLGNQQPAHFMGLLFFALFAATLSLLLQATNRDPKSFKSPMAFSWRFLITDNWRRCLTSLMLIYVALRFTPELFGVEINPFWALAIGFANDKIAQLLKAKASILSKKDKA